MIGQENKGAVVDRVVEFDPAQLGGIVVVSVNACRAHGLIATHAGSEVDGMGIEPGQSQSPFGSNDKERSCLYDAVETSEIEVAPIHNVECARLENQIVEPIDLMNIAGRNVDRGGNRSAQIEQGIDLDRRNRAHGKTLRHRSTVVASRAYTV